jgi:uncharacterized Zn finger protein
MLPIAVPGKRRRMAAPGAPFANILHQDVLRELAGSASFERGQRYHEEKKVISLARREGTLTASVKGSDTYRVQIWVHHESLAYSCSCPQGQEKAFCKHAVATALAWLDECGDNVRPGANSFSIEDAALTAALAKRSREELVALILVAARTNADLRALILHY